MFSSTDGGDWTPAGPVPNERQVDGITADPVTPGLLHITTLDGVYISTDDGATWDPQTAAGTEGLDRFAITADPTGDNGRLYLGTSAGVHRLGAEPPVPEAPAEPVEGGGGTSFPAPLLILGVIVVGAVLAGFVLRRRRNGEG